MDALRQALSMFNRQKMVSPIPESQLAKKPEEPGFFQKLVDALKNNPFTYANTPPEPYQDNSDQAFRDKGWLQDENGNWYWPEDGPRPTPTPTMNSERPYRNPMVEGFLASRGRALKPDEMNSAVDIASQEFGVPRDLLMDIAGLESQAGTWDRPFEEYPGQYADERHARGPYMFLRGTAIGAGGTPEDRYSATESARMTAKKLLKGQLGEWDIADKPGAGGGRLTDWYSEEELEPYSYSSMKRRRMLQELARQLGY